MTEFLALIVLSPIYMMFAWPLSFAAMFFGATLLGLTIYNCWPAEAGWRIFMSVAVPFFLFWGGCVLFINRVGIHMPGC